MRIFTEQTPKTSTVNTFILVDEPQTGAPLVTVELPTTGNDAGRARVLHHDRAGLVSCPEDPEDTPHAVLYQLLQDARSVIQNALNDLDLHGPEALRALTRLSVHPRAALMDDALNGIVWRGSTGSQLLDVTFTSPSSVTATYQTQDGYQHTAEGTRFSVTPLDDGACASLHRKDGSEMDFYRTPIRQTAPAQAD